MAQGHGRTRACTMAGVAYRTFQKRLAEDTDLRDRVVQAERARVDDMTKLIFDLKDHEDASIRLNAAKAFSHRDDRQREASAGHPGAAGGEWGRRSGRKVSATMTRVVDVLWKFCPAEAGRPWPTNSIAWMRTCRRG